MRIDIKAIDGELQPLPCNLPRLISRVARPAAYLEPEPALANYNPDPPSTGLAGVNAQPKLGKGRVYVVDLSRGLEAGDGAVGEAEDGHGNVEGAADVW